MLTSVLRFVITMELPVYVLANNRPINFTNFGVILFVYYIRCVVPSEHLILAASHNVKYLHNSIIISLTLSMLY